MYISRSVKQVLEPPNQLGQVKLFMRQRPTRKRGSGSGILEPHSTPDDGVERLWECMIGGWFSR
jgi:hypothetical protein